MTRCGRIAAWLAAMAVLGLAWAGAARAATGACPATESALQALIAAQSAVTLSCPVATTIPMTTPITVAAGQSLRLDASHSPGKVTLDGGRTSQLFSVSGGSLALDGLTLAHGLSYLGAGAIQNAGTLTVTDSTLSANTSVAGGGGAILNHGTTTVIRSTLTDNQAALGGAILNSGALTVATSTLIGNAAGVGGAVWNSGTAWVANSTLVYNLARGTDIYVYAGSLSIAASILTGGCNGNAVNDQGYNLEADAGASCGFTAGEHDIVGQDPQLGALANHGGPTQTIDLASTSPAAKQIPVSTGLCPATDQRGAPRPARGGSACDMGAYENQEDNVCPVGESQLDELINSSGPITLSCPTATTIPITHALTLTRDVTIDATNSPAPITLRGDGATRLFVNFATLKLGGLTLSGGRAAAGGAIYNEGAGDLSLTASTLSDDAAAGAGGAIWNDGTLNVVASTLAGDTAGTRGGAIETGASGRTTIFDSTLTDDSAGAVGAALDNQGALTVSSSTVAGNRSDWGEGAIASFGALRLTTTLLARNSPPVQECARFSCKIPDDCLILGSFLDGGYNVDDTGWNDLDDPGNSCRLSAPTDLVLYSGFNVPALDVRLGALASNGGPTQTMALLSGSLAIRRIPASTGLCPASDQRGVRSGAGACDTGAYQTGSAGLGAPGLPVDQLACSIGSRRPPRGPHVVAARCVRQSDHVRRVGGPRLRAEPVVISRRGRGYAAGTMVAGRRGRFRLLVSGPRPLAAGHYTLTVERVRGRTRLPIIVVS